MYKKISWLFSWFSIAICFNDIPSVWDMINRQQMEISINRNCYHCFRMALQHLLIDHHHKRAPDWDIAVCICMGLHQTCQSCTRCQAKKRLVLLMFGSVSTVLIQNCVGHPLFFPVLRWVVDFGILRAWWWSIPTQHVLRVLMSKTSWIRLSLTVVDNLHFVALRCWSHVGRGGCYALTIGQMPQS